MGRDGADALDLISGDGDAEASAADEERSVDRSVRHELRRRGRAVRVRRLVVDREAADVYYRFDARVALEVGLDFIFIANAGFLVEVSKSLLALLPLRFPGPPPQYVCMRLREIVVDIHPRPWRFSIWGRPFRLNREDVYNQRRHNKVVDNACYTLNYYEEVNLKF